MWTLRIRGPKGASVTVHTAPDTTMSEFCELVITKLAIKTAKKQPLTFRSGFPPRPVEYAPTNFLRDRFANNDTIVVDTAAPTAEPRQAATATPTRTTSRTKSPTPKPKAKAPKTGIHGLRPPAKKRPPPPSAKRKDRGDGVRLGASLDEESELIVGANEDTPAPPKYRRTQAIHLTSKDDIGIQLAQAVSGGATDRVGKFFRAATTSAVEHQYAMTLANARLRAALASQFEIQELRASTHMNSINSGDTGSPVEMRVRFKESARKWKVEVVTLLQPVELQAALKYILISGGEAGKEMLKPFNMAQCSPRVFWSIARLYNGDVAAGLAALVPEEDWAYLDTRTRQISDKAKEAKENEEMYKQWKKHGSVLPTAVATNTTCSSEPTTRARRGAAEVIDIGSDDDDTDNHATPATTSRAHAEQTEKRALRDAAAHAALARLQTRVRTAEVAAAIKERSNCVEKTEDGDETETETDADEVEPTTTVYCDACSKARILSLAEARTAGVEGGGQQWTCAQLVSLGRSAHCDALDDEVVQIAGEKLGLLLQQQARIHTRQQLANAEPGAATRLLAHPLDANYSEIKSKLEAMIDEARLDEVNDAIAEIVGGDEELVGELELQKLGTPADLVATPVDLIARAMATGEATATAWQRCAREKIASCPWMGEWRTL